jgi:hypothetical protein
MKRILLFLLLSATARGQYFDTLSLSERLAFIHHLVKSGQADDAVFLLSKVNRNDQISNTLILEETTILIRLGRSREADSLLHKYGFLFDNQNANSRCRFLFLKNHLKILSGNTDLKMPECSNEVDKGLVHDVWRMQLLGSALLENSQENFNLIFDSEKSLNPQLSLIEFSLYIHNQEILRRRRKSGFLAGMFSAIIPGSGKLYAGKPHEMFTAFLPVALNFAQAAEGYYYKKLESPHLYFFGSVGTVFYVSNIYGSARAAKRKNEEFNEKIRNNVEIELSKLLPYY